MLFNEPVGHVLIFSEVSVLAELGGSCRLFSHASQAFMLSMYFCNFLSKQNPGYILLFIKLMEHQPLAKVSVQLLTN